MLLNALGHSAAFNGRSSGSRSLQKVYQMQVPAIDPGAYQPTHACLGRSGLMQENRYSTLSPSFECN